MDSDTMEPGVGFTRRELIKRGAVVGGTLMWAAPAVQTFSKAAFAAEGSPCIFCVFMPPSPIPVGRCEVVQACCECLENPPPPPANCASVCGPGTITCVPTTVCP